MVLKTRLKNSIHDICYDTFIFLKNILFTEIRIIFFNIRILLFFVIFIPFFTSGIQLHDTCGSIRLTQKHLFQIITATREPNNVLSLPEFTRGPGGGPPSFALGPPLLGK